MVQWIWVSHRVESALCYWIISERGKVLPCTIFQQLNDDEPRNPIIQERIPDYHGSLEAALVSDKFGISLDFYVSFVIYEEEDTVKGELNEDEYQGLPYYPDIDDIMYNSDEERTASSYDQYIGSEVVLSVFLLVRPP